ncbi:MAG: OmpW family protein [Rhodocyclaceae bacterium]|nr:OmpW family protein [Rhodocyclaceae bacterium]
MNKTLLPLIATAALATAALPAEAKEGDWVVRLRAAHISPEDESRLDLDGIGKGQPRDGANWLVVDSNTIPEVDISYYLTDHIAAELILAVGSRHHVDIEGTAGQPLGSVNLLPPTLLAQWHFRPNQTIDPYIGLGINYTRFMDNTLGTGGGSDRNIHTERNAFGPAIQFGADYNLEGGWLLNVDVKKVWIDTDVSLAGVGKIDRLDINPWVFSVGFGKKF